MTRTASLGASEPGKFRRALAAAWAFLQAMESASFDYTLDRIERLVREVARLKEALGQSRDPSVSRHNPPTMWNLASGKFSQISVAEQGRFAFLSGQSGAAPGSQDTPKRHRWPGKACDRQPRCHARGSRGVCADFLMMRVYLGKATTEAFQRVLAILNCSGRHAQHDDDWRSGTLYPEILVEIEMVARLPEKLME